MSQIFEKAIVTDLEISTERDLHCDVETLFKMFSNPDHLGVWWGPRGFTTSTAEMSFTEGGTWRYVMHGPHGAEFPNCIVYTKIVPNQTIEYDLFHEGEKLELSFHSVITFCPLSSEKTRVKFKVTFPDEKSKKIAEGFGAIEGSKQTIQRLEELALSQNGFVISRVFKASPSEMFEFWTQPEHLKNWLAPTGFDMGYKEVRIEAGGHSEYYMTGPEGAKMSGRISYLELIKPSRLVYIQCFTDENGTVIKPPFSEDWPLRMLTIVTFDGEQKDTQTRVTVRWTPIESTDAEKAFFEAAKPGMTQGWTGSFDKLDAMVQAKG